MNKINYKRVDEIMNEISVSDSEDDEKSLQSKIVNIKNENQDKKALEFAVNSVVKVESQIMDPKEISKNTNQNDACLIKKESNKYLMNTSYQTSYHTGYKSVKNEKNKTNTNNIKTVKPHERTSSVVAKTKPGPKSNNNETMIRNIKVTNISTKTSNFGTNNDKPKLKSEATMRKSSSIVSIKQKTTSNVQTVNKFSKRTSSQIKVDSNLTYGTNFKTFNQTTKKTIPASPSKSGIKGINIYKI